MRYTYEFKNIALTCIGKGNILKHLKAFPKGVFA